MDLDPAAVRRIVAVALEEDLGERGDVTTDALLHSGARSRARILARDDLVLAGGPVAVEVFRALDDSSWSFGSCTPTGRASRRESSSRRSAGTPVRSCVVSGPP